MASLYQVVALFLSQLSGDTACHPVLVTNQTHYAKGIKTKTSKETLGIGTGM